MRPDPILHRARLLLAGFLLMAAALPAQTAPQTPPAAVRAQAFAEELRTKVGSPGLSAAVAVGGKVVWSEGFGLADVENQVRVRPESRFRVGSISKLLTVAAVARLVEQGRLDLDAPIQRYVPSFPDKGQPITARQLAGHLAGIRHYIPTDFVNPPTKTYERTTDALEIFAQDPLLQPPGTKYSYSSFGYNLLGAVIEGALSKEYLAAVDELVIQPLGLRSTMADRPQPIVEHRVRFYGRGDDGALRNERPIDSSYKWPSAGYLATAEDLVRLASAHLEPGFLKADTLALLFTSQKTAAGEETGVGLGWRIGSDAAGRRILHHGGAIEGGRAFVLLYPDQGVAVALLANLSRAGFAEDEAMELAAVFLD